MPTVDQISPSFIGEDLITLQLDTGTPKPHVGSPVIVGIDYSRTLPRGGTSLPVEMVVQGPSQSSFRSFVYKRFLPSILTFIAVEAGEHLVLLRELAHNKLVGTLLVQVTGERH